jgi:hypothetical protein
VLSIQANFPMLRRATVTLLATAVGSLFAAPAPVRPAGVESRFSQAALPDTTAARAPSDSELRERTAKLIENQHNDDAALDQYERVEHYVDRTTGSNSRVILDKTYRVVPNGGGTTKVLLLDRGMPSAPEDYRRQLEMLRGILQMMTDPNDSRAKSAYEKYQKRQHDRADFVEVARSAFIVKWQSRETCGGRPCDAFSLNPDPNFHPHSMYQDAMAHVTGKIYVDRETNQLARGEMDVTSDIYFGGGILGRLSRGSQVSMEQAEAAPGIWLPTRYQYDFSGRKFLFSFTQHQTIEASHYRRIGPPSEALVAIQKELASGKPAPGDL